ncbi:DUF2512 family protein [Halobacillus naozhouensis]|uniref:DUF2512 family protein n=1 Tax=Halobacillus naozhouensis TaxID=554880 RepID=A0ABY8IVG2_9BACI|nr:DUF2512 family protein [Halobacillus naozhouensis]WFT74163.1 DUF2512 family protein [Halobacillus naozhouensis]
MEHVKALAIKGIMTLVVLYLILSLGFEVSFINMLILTAVIGAVSYPLGDLYILPKTNNMTATMADLGVTFIIVWLLGFVLTGMDLGEMAWAAAISAIAIAVGEYFFHFYISKKHLGANKGLRASYSH